LKLLLSRAPSPIGAILLVTDGTRLCALEFEDYADRLQVSLRRQYHGQMATPADDPTDTTACLAAYFAGDVTAIDQLPVAAAGTAFQNQVWAALRQIPAGATTQYGRLATSIGRPTAIRAVGTANGANPISIVVPCHRVIGANGSLTGYGGGLPRKAWLLAHEAKYAK
jgi:methylated-DNA-[protein]-cysteine S-methyltransferase